MGWGLGKGMTRSLGIRVPGSIRGRNERARTRVGDALGS